MRFEITNEHLIDGVLPEDFIWPDAVTKISAASDCVIRGLTNIPAGVTKLDLLVCRNLRSLDLSGANGLQEVDLRNSAIEILTNIPDCVTKLDLRNSAIRKLNKYT